MKSYIRKPTNSTPDAFAKRQGFLRLDMILAPLGPLPISKSSWWSKVRTGEYPQPVKLGPRTTAWRVADILDLIERLESRHV
ncbi:AlpA family phage regulatory protein [Rhizobium sp. NZLR1]|uniref:helix-turn-helix transcriptional regulator n=2 Tax=Rhizobium sp. NZLR1 TaxID=2731096 RepID=UPI001A99318D|nr:AlpA family phage regulatory protein [Rhizobium sp. NZLR1]QSZ21544.1 AlpA family phage regulatory protein [Rhizobium sp. NZLR1]